MWPGITFREGPRNCHLHQIKGVSGKQLTRLFQVFIGPIAGQGGATRADRFVGADEVVLAQTMVVRIAYHVRAADTLLTDLMDLMADDEAAIIQALEFSPLWGSARPAKLEPTGGGQPDPFAPGGDEDVLGAAYLLTLVFELFNEYP